MRTLEPWLLRANAICPTAGIGNPGAPTLVNVPPTATGLGALAKLPPSRPLLPPPTTAIGVAMFLVCKEYDRSYHSNSCKLALRQRQHRRLILIHKQILYECARHTCKGVDVAVLRFADIRVLCAVDGRATSAFRTGDDRRTFIRCN